MARKSKCPDPPPEGAPAWMTTYGDMVTLLLTFFVLLISFSSVQEAKFKKAMRSLQGALGVLSKNGGAAVDTGTQDFPNRGKPLSDDELQKALMHLNAVIRNEDLSGMIKVEQSSERIHIRIANPVLFESGSALLRPGNDEVLDGIAALLSNITYDIRIEGHTDNIPIATAQFPSNWELSGSRATSVVRSFVDRGIDPTRFIAVGFGEFHPIDSNDTETGRAHNRRVDIYINLKKMSIDTTVSIADSTGNSL